MGSLDMTKTAAGREKTKIYRRRLNILLEFARLDPWKLDNGAREKLLDDLHWAMYGLPRKREVKENDFNRAATPEGVGDAQRRLLRLIETGRAKLTEQTLMIREFDESSKF